VGVGGIPHPRPFSPPPPSFALSSFLPILVNLFIIFFFIFLVSFSFFIFFSFCFSVSFFFVCTTVLRFFTVSLFSVRPTKTALRPNAHRLPSPIHGLEPP
jgi:hypothetical protein